MGIKCVVPNCVNESDQGDFAGCVCMPCYEYLLLKSGTHSQAYRNDIDRKHGERIREVKRKKEREKEFNARNQSWERECNCCSSNYSAGDIEMFCYEMNIGVHLK